MKKILIYCFIFFQINFLLYPDNLLTKSGLLLKGEIVSITKDNILFLTNENIINFIISKIDLLIPDYNKHLSITIYKKNNTKFKVNVIKLTEHVIYYENILEINNIKTINFVDIKKIIYFNFNKSNYKIIDYNNNEIIDINQDIDLLIEIIYNSKKDIERYSDISKEELLSISRSNIINISDFDFYEKYWIKINQFLEINLKNFIWNLLEEYSKIEKNPVLVNNMKDNDYKNYLLILRKTFHIRCKKIILIEEMIYKN